MSTSLRIRIEDLSPLESISEEEMSQIYGAGRRRKWQFSGAAADVLEQRQMMSVNSIWFSGRTLVVKANDQATNVEVRSTSSSIQIKDVGAGKAWTYSKSQVSQVEFQGGAGNDRFVNYVQSLPVRGFGNGGNDYLEGYDGADELQGGSGNDTIKGYGGNDKLFGGSGEDYIDGGSGDDDIEGGDNNDRLIGGAGKDKLWGQAGNDFLWGGTDNDRLMGGSGNDELMGEAGNDILFGDSGNDKLWGGTGNDELQGGSGNDDLYGDAGNDRLFGDGDVDRLWGGDGNDMLNGGTGRDEHYGGDGVDSAWLSQSGEVVTGTSEQVNIRMPGGTPQETNMCGPNSAWRVIQSYGGTATHRSLINSAGSNSAVARLKLGTEGAALVRAMNANRTGIGSHTFSLKTRSGVNEIINELKQGRPVVAMISVGNERASYRGIGINVPWLHWVAVDGFDAVKGEIYYTDTNGSRYGMTMASFGSALNWSADALARTFLQGLGVVPGTFIV